MEKNWREATGKGCRIAVIDSGVNTAHPALQGAAFTGVSILSEESAYRVEPTIEDEVGHGTGVVSTIRRIAPDAQIIIIRLFHHELEVRSEALLHALEYVEEHVECDILHMSLGLTHGGETALLRDKCAALAAKGMVIVSAFDNDGTLSFPAVLPDVIGVDGSHACKGDEEYEYVEGSVVNIRARGTPQRVAWVEPLYAFVGGASFAAAYVSGYAARIMETGVRGRHEILDVLRQGAVKIFPAGTPTREPRLFPIRRAVLFPFNKEMHSLARFQDLLTFEIHAICDTKYSGVVGAPISKVLRTATENDHKILNVDDLDWQGDFDTLILGHVDLLSLTMRTDLFDRMVRLAMEHGKQIYSFDRLEGREQLVEEVQARGLEIFNPTVDRDRLPKNRFGKLRKVGKPVLGIFGTSSQQGKFTLQMTLRRRLLQDGYAVGQLGTEPSALLYGFDEVYPMGYGSTVKVNAFDAVQVLNDMMARIEEKDPDLILVGSQSGTVPYDLGHVSQYTFPALEFLLGTSPDAFVLCVNPDDPLPYIRRTIEVLNNLGVGKTIGLVIFPLRKSTRSWMGTKMEQADGASVEELRSRMTAEFGLPAYLLSNSEDMERLYESVIDFYS